MSTGFNLSQGAIKRPASSQSFPHGTAIEAQVLGPLGECHRHPIVRESRSVFVRTCRSSVVTLFKRRSPLTVLWAIRPVVVNPIQRRPRRSLAHIHIERYERLSPWGMDGNTARAVEVEIWGFGVGATLNHSVPRMVLGGCRHTMRRFSWYTPARNTVGVFEFLSRPCEKVSTVAGAQPTQSTLVHSNRGNRHSFVKDLASKILSASGKVYNLRGHFDTLSIEVIGRARVSTPRLPPILTPLWGVAR